MISNPSLRRNKPINFKLSDRSTKALMFLKRHLEASKTEIVDDLIFRRYEREVKKLKRQRARG